MRITSIEKADRMADILSEVKKNLEDGSNIDAVTPLLEELSDLLEQIDMAQIFVKFGGLDVIFRIIQISGIQDENDQIKPHVQSLYNVAC
jgi:hypothetical protein